MPHVSTDEGERSVSENHTDPAAAEQTSEASLTPKSAGRKKRRIETRYGLTPGHLINEADIWLIILDHCCNTENISFMTQTCFFREDTSSPSRSSSLPAKRYLRITCLCLSVTYVSHARIIVSDLTGELREENNRKWEKTVTQNIRRIRVWNLTNNPKIKVHYWSYCCPEHRSTFWCIVTLTCFLSARLRCVIVAQQQLVEAAGGIVWASVSRWFVPGQHLSKFHIR